MKLYLFSAKQLILFMALVTFFNSSSAQNVKWIPFNWEGETIEGVYYDKFAMSIPVTIENLPYAFKMQLDLGAENTIIYGNTITNYLNKSLNDKIDTALQFYFSNKKYPMFRDIDFKLGKVSIGKINIGYLKGYGNGIPEDSIRTKSEKFIGTISPDVFKNKTLIIDYPNKRIGITDKVPVTYSDVYFQPFKIKNGRIKIPFTIGNYKTDLLFDTGSSMFSLLTTEARADEVSDQKIIDSVKTSSWGDHYYVYGRKVIVPIKFGNNTLNSTTVFFDKKHKFDEFYKRENIWGITGNAYFINNIIIINYTNNLIGVK